MITIVNTTHSTPEDLALAEHLVARYKGSVVRKGNGRTHYRVVEIRADRINTRLRADGDNKCLVLEDVVTGRRAHATSTELVSDRGMA